MKNIGFSKIEVPSIIINELHEKGKTKLLDQKIDLYPNLYLELISLENKKQTSIAHVNESLELEKIKSIRPYTIKPRNKEQTFAIHALFNQKSSVVVLTGLSGSGKTIATLSAALKQVQENKYDKIIITRPTSEVGKHKLGFLPGSAIEKTAPHLLNYFTNIEQILGCRISVEDLSEKYNIEIVPLQLIRGASFLRTFIIADEMQICPSLDILTLGTRIGEGSKLVIMGDLDQRDDNISIEKTGLYKLLTSEIVKQSELFTVIELQQCERSKTAELFSKIFKEG